MSRFDARALNAALAANEAWSPPGDPRPLEEIAPYALLPDAAYAAAADLGYSREEADEIVLVFYGHIGSFQQLTTEEIQRNEMGRAIGFGMFWAYLAAQRARMHSPPTPERIDRVAQALFLDARRSTRMPSPRGNDLGDLPEGWWEQVPGYQKRQYRHEAEVALIAL